MIPLKKQNKKQQQQRSLISECLKEQISLQCADVAIAYPGLLLLSPSRSSSICSVSERSGFLIWPFVIKKKNTKPTFQHFFSVFHQVLTDHPKVRKRTFGYLRIELKNHWYKCSSHQVHSYSPPPPVFPVYFQQWPFLSQHPASLIFSLQRLNHFFSTSMILIYSYPISHHPNWFSRIFSPFH